MYILRVCTTFIDVCMITFFHCITSLHYSYLDFCKNHIFQFLSEQTRTFCLFRWTRSLYQSDTDQQSSCWHWKGECWFEWDQRCDLIRFIMLFCKKTEWNDSSETKVCNTVKMFLNFVVILQSHKPHIIDLDAVLNEEASQRDVYESTTKVQRMFFLARIGMFNTSP